MSDRAALFLFGIFMIVISLGAAVWLLANGQAGAVDGLFLLLSALLIAVAFGLYVKFVIGAAMDAQKQSAAQAARPAAAKPEAKPTLV